MKILVEQAFLGIIQLKTTLEVLSYLHVQIQEGIRSGYIIQLTVILAILVFTTECRSMMLKVSQYGPERQSFKTRSTGRESYFVHE